MNRALSTGADHREVRPCNDGYFNPQALEAGLRGGPPNLGVLPLWTRLRNLIALSLRVEYRLHSSNRCMILY